MSEHEPIPERGRGRGMDPDPKHHERLRWRCRRGLLELDVLLQGFMGCGFESLGQKQRQAFESLLDYPDQVLLELLMGHRPPLNSEIGDVIARIRASAAPGTA